MRPLDKAKASGHVVVAPGELRRAMQEMWNACEAEPKDRTIPVSDAVMRVFIETRYELGDINACERARLMWNSGARGAELRGR